MTRTCDDCEHAFGEDYGWSNWTVEGTYIHCMRGLHPDAPFDRWYGEEPKLKFAETCDAFSDGPHWYLDVDGEILDELPSDVRAWWQGVHYGEGES